MTNDSILLLTKDAQHKSYYPLYGGHYWDGKMPNYMELAGKGTVFNRFYTAAPSSNMSYLSMFTMKYPYQQDIMDYISVGKDYPGETLFDILSKVGYECHIIWDESWDPDIKYTRCYRNTVIHSIKDLKQAVGAHFLHKGILKADDSKVVYVESEIIKVLREITGTSKKIFIWCHLPHVLNGRTAYGSDMDVFDEIIGIFRQYFNDNNIFISADHGNMNGNKGKVGYGFDVYEDAICIPFISPRIADLEKCENNICNIDLVQLLLYRRIPQRDIIISDSAYYAQANRKTAFIYGNYRYIYNKINKTEELYDIQWDPNQNFNLIEDEIYDQDRKVIIGILYIKNYDIAFFLCIKR